MFIGFRMFCVFVGGDKFLLFDIGDCIFNLFIFDVNCCVLLVFGVLVFCELGDKGVFFIFGLLVLLGSVEVFDFFESIFLRRYGLVGEVFILVLVFGFIVILDGLFVRILERGINVFVCFVWGDLGEWGDWGEWSCFVGIVEEEGRDWLEIMVCVMGGVMGIVNGRLYDMLVVD